MSNQDQVGVGMNEQEFLASRARAKAERIAEASAKQLSEAVRGTPLGQLLIKVGTGLEYGNEMAAFVEDQWDAYKAAQELRVERTKRGREEEESSDCCCAME